MNELAAAPGGEVIVYESQDGEIDREATRKDFFIVRPYRSGGEKAANLLYFLVKDHPFTDGNKRIGTLLFLLYLAQEGIAHRLDPRGLTALTLLIAESAPANKDLMIRLIVNLLGESGE